MKALNVFAIIVAWILSIVLVLMLIAAPLTLSALSMLSPENIVELVGNALVEDNKIAAVQPQGQIVLQNLSAEVEQEPEEVPTTGNVAGGMDLSGLQDILGGEVMFNKLMESQAMSELLGAYVKDVTNAFAGKNAEKEFTAELLAEVVQENIDEIVDIVSTGTTLTDEEKEQLKQQIQTGVVEKADEIVKEIPSAEEIKESVLEGDEGLAIAFEILAMRNQIKGVIVGVIIVVAALIFALRFPGFRGLRWLSIDLLIASLFNGMICKALGASSVITMGLYDSINAMGSNAEGVIGMLITQLANGVVVRTIIMFVAAVALMVGYILLKKFMRKKKVVAESVAEEVVPDTVPAFVPATAAVETEQVAETAETQEIAAEETAEEPAPTEEV